MTAGEYRVDEVHEAVLERRTGARRLAVTGYRVVDSCGNPFAHLTFRCDDMSVARAQADDLRAALDWARRRRDDEAKLAERDLAERARTVKATRRCPR